MWFLLSAHRDEEKEDFFPSSTCSSPLCCLFSFFCLSFCHVSFFFFFSVQCPAHEVRFDSTGVILSPGFPENYPNLQMCSWLINVEKGYNITLHFELFQTEKEFDILEIFDGESLVLKLIVIFLYVLFPYADISNFTPSVLNKVCIKHSLENCVCVLGPNIYSQSMASLSGDIETPFNLTTTGHQLLLRWSSDHGTNRRGFHIRYVGEYQSMYPIYKNILLLLLHPYSKNK